MRKKAGEALLFLLVLLVVFTAWDNRRIVIIDQDIPIDHLPKELEGFKIVQVTDLHEKEFGKDQKRLIEAINSIEYDAIIFTGDILDGPESENYASFYSLLDGIKNKEHALYIPGNSDPDVFGGNVERPLDKSDFIKGMEMRSVTFVESIYTIDAGRSAIRFVDFESSILNVPGKVEGTVERPKPQNASLDQFEDYQKERIKELAILNQAGESDVLIALNHYPVADARMDSIAGDPGLSFRAYDLIIAGHYHGGQLRLPLIGALFVPEAWNRWYGFFPPQDRVKGLWKYRQTQQYVSAGLGSSGPFFLRFRLFNPPEINVLKLRAVPVTTRNLSNENSSGPRVLEDVRLFH